MSARRLLSIAVMACLFCATLAACREPEPIRLGFLGGLTGRAAGLGTSGRNGFLLAIEQANEAGGINGRRIEAVIGDDRMDPGQAATTLQELYRQQVVAVVGPMTSQIAIAVAPEANRARVPMISPTVSTNQLSGQDDYFLRVYYNNTQAAGMLADYLASSPKKPRMAAIYDLANRAYTEDWLKDFRQLYGKWGGEVLAAVPFDSTQGIVFGKIVDQALQKNPEGILFLASAVDSAMLAQQLAKRGIKVPIFATGWSATDDLLQMGGRSVEGLVLIQSADQESQAATHREFVQGYTERFNEKPKFPALHAYDATRMVIAALAKGQAEGPQLKASLLALPPQPGAQGLVCFDEFGDLCAPELHLAVVKDGSYRTLH